MRADLARAYESAVYVAELPAGNVEFRVGAVPHGPAPDTSLAIITAWNPGIERPAEAANQAANRQLEAALREAGWRYFPACGRSEDGSHAEPSFAVTGIDPDTAVDLACSFRQAAVFYWDGSASRLLWCDMRHKSGLSR